MAVECQKKKNKLWILNGDQEKAFQVVGPLIEI